MKLMKLSVAFGSAAVLFCAKTCAATHAHRHAHTQFARRHVHSHIERGPEEGPALERRATCTLPNDPDIVPVPGASNGGFAMAPNVACTYDMWCPYACVPGKVINQWKPGTSYVVGESMLGGVHCNSDGTTTKPRDGPYCVPGTGTVGVVNKCGSVVSFCQTQTPGDEGMYIPNDVHTSLTLAVPGPDFWAGISAHYYINAPGTPSSIGCEWGTSSNAWGNWAAYVAGANTDSNGNTFMKIGFNPIWLGSPLTSQTPNYGLKIECEGGGCNGLPCSIDPAKNPINTVQGPAAAISGNGDSYCVVTVPPGSKANIVVFPAGDPDATGSSSSSASAPPPPPSPKSSSSSTTTATTTSTTSTATSQTTPTTTALTTKASHSLAPLPLPSSVSPGIFHENDNSTNTTTTLSSTSGSAPITTSASLTIMSSPTAAPTSSKNDAIGTGQAGGAIVGLIVAFVAATFLY